MLIEEIITENYSNWDHKESADYSKHLEKTFGAPDEMTDEQTVWHNVDGFKRIVCRDEYILHGSPAPHYDFIYCYIDLEVPEDLSDELAKCSGSILIDHLKNEVGARCGSLTANATTLNFVLDVVAGRAEPVKEEYEKRILAMKDMFEKGERYELDWWPDESGDADPDNPYYAESALDEASSPWTSSGKHPEDMDREELEHEIDIFKQYEKMGMSLSPKEIMRMDSLYDYLDTVDDIDEANINTDFYKRMVKPPNKNPTFKSNMPIVTPNNDKRNRRFVPAPMPGMPGFGTDSNKNGKQIPWMREGKINEGYEGEVSAILQALDIEHHWSDGRLHVNKRDVDDVRDRLADTDMEMPKISIYEKSIGFSDVKDKWDDMSHTAQAATIGTAGIATGYAGKKYGPAVVDKTKTAIKNKLTRTTKPKGNVVNFPKSAKVRKTS